MGTFEVNARIFSTDNSAQEQATMLVDTGATFSLLPASVLRRLGVHEQASIEVEYATGQMGTVPMGLALMQIEGFTERLPILVLFGEEGARPLLGAHALEAFRLVVDPIAHELRPRRALLMRAQ